MVGLIALGVVAVLYALSAGRLDRWSIGAPIVFPVAVIVLGPAVTGRLDIPHDSEPVKVVTELTLALILFADASTIGLRRLRGDAVIPLRLLVVGLPLTRPRCAPGPPDRPRSGPGGGWAMAGLIATILTPRPLLRSWRHRLDDAPPSRDALHAVSASIAWRTTLSAG